METRAIFLPPKGARCARGNGERGQAMLFTLLFAGATALICLLLYNSATLANAKTKLQNAADAGAYSSGLLLARDHNFSAYTNRAMVANQVAVAQFVSLKSYLEDASDTRTRLTNAQHTEQSRRALVKPSWVAAKLIPMRAIYNSYLTMARSSVKTIDTLIEAFSHAQELHHLATTANLIFIADEVVKRNDSLASVSKGTFQIGNAVMQIDRWKGYTNRHRANDPSAQADRFANVVVSEQSTDQFIRDRESSPLPGWESIPSQYGCPKPLIPIWTSFEFEHRGGTILSSNKKRWLAMDATMGKGWVWCQLKYLPIRRTLRDGNGGSGGAVAGAGGAYNDRIGFRGNPVATRYYGRALTHSDTRRPARLRYAKGPGSTLDGSAGLQDYYRDVSNTSGTPANQSPELNGGQAPLTIEVVREGNSIRTAAKILPGAKKFTLDDRGGLKGNSMRALSSAHAYFYRANTDSSVFTKTGWKRADNRSEMANLFNPYWQARLVDRTDDERIASVQAQ